VFFSCCALLFALFCNPVFCAANNLINSIDWLIWWIDNWLWEVILGFWFDKTHLHIQTLWQYIVLPIVTCNYDACRRFSDQFWQSMCTKTPSIKRRWILLTPQRSMLLQDPSLQMISKSLAVVSLLIISEWWCDLCVTITQSVSHNFFCFHLCLQQTLTVSPKMKVNVLYPGLPMEHVFVVKTESADVCESWRGY